MLIFLIWVLFGICSFFLLCKSFTYQFDVKLSDAIFFTFIAAMGPVGFAASLIIFMILSCDYYKPFKDKVLFKKRMNKKEL